MSHNPQPTMYFYIPRIDRVTKGDPQPCTLTQAFALKRRWGGGIRRWNGEWI